MDSAVIRIQCKDRKGLVASITGLLYQNGLNITSNHEFVEPETQRFFMRTEVENQLDAEKLQVQLAATLPASSLIAVKKQERKNIVILVSKEPHCLGDLLIRCAYQEINANILAILSNHSVLAELTHKFNQPFHYVTHENKTREAHENELLKIIKPYRPDYLVLAKYMRILTPSFVNAYPYKVINIHHSFLPAFVGANPYRQAYQRGVKIIGATAHFVTAELDEGPIIAQSVNPVEHQHSPKDLAKAGHDIEKIVLSRALSLVLEDRVFISGNKTIIFD